MSVSPLFILRLGVELFIYTHNVICTAVYQRQYKQSIRLLRIALVKRWQAWRDRESDNSSPRHNPPDIFLRTIPPTDVSHAISAIMGHSPQVVASSIDKLRVGNVRRGIVRGECLGNMCRGNVLHPASVARRGPALSDAINPACDRTQRGEATCVDRVETPPIPARRRPLIKSIRRRRRTNLDPSGPTQGIGNNASKLAIGYTIRRPGPPHPATLCSH